eukprot:560601-Prymnesium_polylepis.2
MPTARRRLAAAAAAVACCCSEYATAEAVLPRRVSCGASLGRAWPERVSVPKATSPSPAYSGAIGCSP